MKERKIKDVLESVALWRKLYYGFHDSDQKWIQMTLDQAANMINISKKTLDDYLSQIRFCLYQEKGRSVSSISVLTETRTSGS